MFGTLFLVFVAKPRFTVNHTMVSGWHCAFKLLLRLRTYLYREKYAYTRRRSTYANTAKQRAEETHTPRPEKFHYASASYWKRLDTCFVGYFSYYLKEEQSDALELNEGFISLIKVDADDKASLCTVGVSVTIRIKTPLWAA